jgi:endogenous inhibitor of DNA gyrase (YacG/DUF329 family)
MNSTRSAPLKVACPICRKAIPYEGNPYRPFCSERCKSIDLGEWATEGYVVEGKNSEVEEDNVSTSTKEESN